MRALPMKRLLITDGVAGRTGVEVRTPDLDVTTLSRLEPDGALPATGWDARFESVDATLHLPPGHRLLAAWGVDDAPDAWLDRWQLLDLFLLMLVTAAAYRLLGWRGAAVAASAYSSRTTKQVHRAGSGSTRSSRSRLRAWFPRDVCGPGSGCIARARSVALGLVLVPFAVTQYRLAIASAIAGCNSPTTVRQVEGNVDRPSDRPTTCMNRRPRHELGGCLADRRHTAAVRKEAPAGETSD